MVNLPLMLFPRYDEEGRCIECGSHLNFCTDCQKLWVGSHICERQDDYAAD